MIVVSGRYFRDSWKPVEDEGEDERFVSPAKEHAGGRLNRRELTFCEDGDVISMLLDHLGNCLAQLVVVLERLDYWYSSEVPKSGRVEAVDLLEGRVGRGEEGK